MTEQDVIKALNELNEAWPQHLQLFAASGSLCLVDKRTGRELAMFPYIACDGGDPDWRYSDEDGDYYLVQDEPRQKGE